MPGASLYRLRQQSIQSKRTKPKPPESPPGKTPGNTVSSRERDTYSDNENAVPNLGLEGLTKAYKRVTKFSGIRAERARRSILGVQLDNSSSMEEEEEVSK